MEIDLRNTEGANASLVKLDATSLNAIFEYCRQRGFDAKIVNVVRFGESNRSSLAAKIGWASVIAQKLEAVVHFSHNRTPITSYSSIQHATAADYKRRADAGEVISEDGPGAQCDDD